MTDGSGNSFSSHAGKVKILKLHYEKLGSELDMKSFDDSWKEEVSNSVKYFEMMSFQDLVSNGILDQQITLPDQGFHWNAKIVAVVVHCRSGPNHGQLHYYCQELCMGILAAV